MTDSFNYSVRQNKVSILRQNRFSKNFKKYEDNKPTLFLQQNDFLPPTGSAPCSSSKHSTPISTSNKKAFYKYLRAAGNKLNKQNDKNEIILENYYYSFIKF